MAPVRDESALVQGLVREVGLTVGEANLYLALVKEGGVPARKKPQGVQRLLDEGMVILSGDNAKYIPVHPRLAVANHYRAWREAMVREIGERRMRVDKIILELIPLYEAAMEKRTSRTGARR